MFDVVAAVLLFSFSSCACVWGVVTAAVISFTHKCDGYGYGEYVSPLSLPSLPSLSSMSVHTRVLMCWMRNVPACLRDGQVCTEPFQSMEEAQMHVLTRHEDELATGSSGLDLSTALAMLSVQGMHGRARARVCVCVLCLRVSV
jgi:hypothetical protein